MRSSSTILTPMEKWELETGLKNISESLDDRDIASANLDQVLKQVLKGSRDAIQDVVSLSKIFEDESDSSSLDATADLNDLYETELMDNTDGNIEMDNVENFRDGCKYRYRAVRNHRHNQPVYHFDDNLDNSIDDDDDVSDSDYIDPEDDDNEIGDSDSYNSNEDGNDSNDDDYHNDDNDMLGESSYLSSSASSSESNNDLEHYKERLWTIHAKIQTTLASIRSDDNSVPGHLNFDFDHESNSSHSSTDEVMSTESSDENRHHWNWRGQSFNMWSESCQDKKSTQSISSTSIPKVYIPETVSGPCFRCTKCGIQLAPEQELCSKNFQGVNGPAMLFRHVINVDVKKVEWTNFVTGHHRIAQVHCACCNQEHGWLYIQSLESSESYKEGKYVLGCSYLYRDNAWHQKAMTLGEMYQIDEQEPITSGSLCNWAL